MIVSWLSVISKECYFIYIFSLFFGIVFMKHYIKKIKEKKKTHIDTFVFLGYTVFNTNYRFFLCMLYVFAVIERKIVRNDHKKIPSTSHHWRRHRRIQKKNFLLLYNYTILLHIQYILLYIFYNLVWYFVFSPIK